jgi:hypothetical protein
LGDLNYQLPAPVIKSGSNLDPGNASSKLTISDNLKAYIFEKETYREP